MKQKKKRNRWKKIMTLLLSAAMLAPAAPGAAYASENPNDSQILEYGVPEDAGSEEPGALADEGNGHDVKWNYRKLSGNEQEIIATRPGSLLVIGVTLLYLTIQVDPDVEPPVTVLKDDVALSQNNEWGIEYKIIYCKADPDGEPMGDWKEEPPTEPGAYKVRVVFGGEEGPYLERDYLLRHDHEWLCIKISDSTQRIIALCMASGCPLSGSQTITLQVTDGAKRRGVVLANGEELPPDNDLEIPYEIKYYKTDPETGGLAEWKGSAPPQAPGSYQARAIFAGREELYLKEDYSIEPHIHRWNYGELPSDGSADGLLICRGNAYDADCPISLDLALKAEPENERAMLLANGKQLPHENVLGIEYEIQYYQEGEPAGAEENPPTEPGEYQVRAIFGGDAAHYLEADYFVHGHKWKYKKTESGLTATCIGNENGSVCDISGSVSLALKVESENKVQVLANGERLLHENAFGIEYEIKYLKGEAPVGTEENLPTVPGEYKVRAIFGDDEANYLEADYRIAHKCSWEVEKVNDKTIKAICTGAGECDKGAEAEFTLTVKDSTFNGKNQNSLAKISVKNENDPKTQAALKALEEQGISTTLKYYKDASGKPDVSTNTLNTLKDAGTYHVQMTVGQETVSDTITITQAKKTSNGNVKMVSYAYGSGEAKAPSLSGVKGKIKGTVEWHYYKGKTEQKVSKFSSTCLNTGTYTVSARYMLAGEGNYYYETKAAAFKVAQGTRSGITVKMGSYGLKCRTAKRPSPGLNRRLDGNAKVTYYYSTKKATKGSKVWDKTSIRKPGVYYMYAVIHDIKSNYKPYTTPLKKITVYAEHNWKDMPKSLFSHAIIKKGIKCALCGEKKTVKLPKKEVSLVIGKSMWLNGKNGNGCEFALGKSAKVNKAYFTLSKKGRITTKANPAYYKSMPKSVPVKVTVCGKTYAMKVKLEIPAPKVTIVPKEVNPARGEGYYRFEFHYNVPGADRVKVEMDKATKTGAISKYLDQNVRDPRPTTPPYINLAKSLLTQLGNKVTFRITAHYGKNKSNTIKKTILVN